MWLNIWLLLLKTSTRHLLDHLFFFAVNLITVAVMLFVECCLEKKHFLSGQELPNMHNNQAGK